PDAEQAAGLLRPGAVAGLLAGRGGDVDALEVRRAALDAGEAEPQLLRREGLEAPAVAVGRVLTAVVGPGERPVVAAPGLADDRFPGRPGEARDGLARRVRGGPGLPFRRPARPRAGETQYGDGRRKRRRKQPREGVRSHRGTHPLPRAWPTDPRSATGPRPNRPVRRCLPAARPSAPSAPAGRRPPPSGTRRPTG